MSGNTKIEWCDHTFNPWEGCTKVSPGCANCYAETRNARWNGGTAPNWGKGAPRRRTSAANWRQPLQWEKGAVASGIRPKVFCASLADWLDDEVPVEWLADLLGLISLTPHLDWLLLTKRPQNWYERVSLVSGELAESWIDVLDMPDRGVIPANVWVGTTVEDQIRADERIPKVLEIPARVRFLSCEPLLGAVNLAGERLVHLDTPFAHPGRRLDPLIDWVICGGESGPKARPMHPDWARSMRDQCAATGVPFFFKQWGEWAPDAPVYPEDDEDDDPELDGRIILESTGYQVAVMRDRLEYQPEPRSWLMRRTGKKAAGRLLDGVEHSAFPKASTPQRLNG